MYVKEVCNTIAKNLCLGKVRVVSNRLYIKETNMANLDVCIEANEKTHMVTARQYVPGDPRYMDSYQAKCAGILAGYILISLICKY